MLLAVSGHIIIKKKEGERSLIKVEVSEFEKQCSKLIDEVGELGKTIVITKDGVPVSQLAPYVERPQTLFGHLRGSVTVKGDIIGPVLAVGTNR